MTARQAKSHPTATFLRHRTDDYRAMEETHRREKPQWPANRIRQFREARDMTLEGLAENARQAYSKAGWSAPANPDGAEKGFGINKQSISAWEKGERTLSVAQLLALSNALRVPPAALLADHGRGFVVPPGCGHFVEDPRLLSVIQVWEALPEVSRAHLAGVVDTMRPPSEASANGAQSNDIVSHPAPADFQGAAKRAAGKAKPAS
jgi:transcriptional regulator with XRE-family HTH domain